MPSIILVGPWERCSAGGLENYINYVNNLRGEVNNLRIVYSSIDPPGMIPDGIFDYVLSNKIPQNIRNEKYSANKTARLYAMNSYLGAQLCEGDSLIRVRSDLKIKNFSAIRVILEAVDKSPDKLIIDYSKYHNNILPFNFSDFFVAGRSDQLQNLFDVFLEMPNISSISFHPFTSHIAGRTRGIMTNEQFLWYSYYCAERKITGKIDSIASIIYSILFLKNKITLINRNILFEFDEKYNAIDNMPAIDCISPYRISSKMIAQNIKKDFMKYYIKSFQHLISKVIN